MGQSWDVLDQVFTVQTIMTAKRYILHWTEGASLAAVWEKADALLIDSIPVMRGEEVTAILQRANPHEPAPIGHDQLVAPDMPIYKVVEQFVEGQYDCLLVLQGNGIAGMVTPADLNKLPARTYYYTLVARLEVGLLAFIRDHFADDINHALVHISDADKFHERFEGKKKDAAPLEPDIWHNFYLSDLVNIIKHDAGLRNRLAFTSKKSVNKQLGGVNDLRKGIAHPNNLIVDNDHGFDTLHKRTQVIHDVLSRLKREGYSA